MPHDGADGGGGGGGGLRGEDRMRPEDAPHDGEGGDGGDGGGVHGVEGIVPDEAPNDGDNDDEGADDEVIFKVLENGAEGGVKVALLLRAGFSFFFLSLVVGCRFKSS